MVARVLVLSEDSGKQGQPTVEKVFRAAVRLLVPSFDSRLLELRPLQTESSASQALRGNAWKEQRPTPARQLLLGTIANELAQGHFVVFHVDSDTIWSKRRLSDNRKKFEKIVRELVKQLLMSSGARPGIYQSRTDEEASELVRNLFAMHPCYSIESWLYQSTLELKTRCRHLHDNARHQTMIDSWATDRSLLDEVEQPKDEALGSCVKDQHNEALATEFPAVEVHAVRKSWHEFVEVVRACRPFLERLAPP